MSTTVSIIVILILSVYIYNNVLEPFKPVYSNNDDIKKKYITAVISDGMFNNIVDRIPNYKYIKQRYNWMDPIIFEQLVNLSKDGLLNKDTVTKLFYI